MRHLPCIPDEIVSAEDRAMCYDVEEFGEQDYHTIPRLCSIIDALAGAYLDVGRERDRYKGVCQLAGDDEFWKALKLLDELGTAGDTKTEITETAP